MNYVWTSLKKHHKIMLFLIIVLVVGLISGFIYFNLVKENIVINLKDELLNLDFNLNNFIFHGIVLSIIILFSFLIIGNVFGLFVYFYEAMSIGFILGSFFSYYGFSGFVYGIIYCFLFKIVYLICLTLILVKVFNLTKNIVGYFLLKKDGVLKELAISNFITIIKLFFVIICSDIFLLFLGNNIMQIFGFLIEK